MNTALELVPVEHYYEDNGEFMFVENRAIRTRVLRNGTHQGWRLGEWVNLVQRADGQYVIRTYHPRPAGSHRIHRKLPEG